MLQENKHNIKTATGLLMIIAVFFCVLFGQGAHLHDFYLHIGDHIDINAHVHAHESHDDEPFQQDSDQDEHRHQVSTASDIIGTLTSPSQVKPDLESYFVISFDAAVGPIHVELDDTSTLFDLPPPRSVLSQYYLSSFSHRGPPIA